MEDKDIMKTGNARFLRTIPLVLITIMLCPSALSKIIYVDFNGQMDFDNVQAGINNAEIGDTVLVMPGEYIITDPITFQGKAIIVKSEAGPDETTIRMGTPADTNRGSVVVFENGETAASVLDGFTITGGRGCWRVDPYPPGNRWSGWVGGGILCWEASPTIVACKIAQNRVVDHGAGVLCLNSDVILTNCIIAENSAGVDCGGMNAISGSSPSLTNCTIRGNSATRFAGGVESWDKSSVTMTNCIIAENSTAQDAGAGVACLDASLTMIRCRIIRNTAQNWFAGGIYVGGSGGRAGSAIITNCIIAQNTATRGGGGVACSYPGASLTISNCTIWGNSGGSYWGGGGVLCRNASATVTNSIIWGNTSPKGPEISVEDPASTLTIAYSNVDGGRTRVSVEGGCTLNWGTGNIDADPLFARVGYWDQNGTRDPLDDFWVAGDYHLKSQYGHWTSANSVEPDPNSESWIQNDVTSPCIDAGDPNTPVGNEPEPNGGVINMGAYGGTAEASKSDYTWWFATTEGPVVAEGLGIILPHEHIFTDLRGPTTRGYGEADTADVVRVMAPLLEEARQKGVGVLIECSSIGVGRNVSILSQVSQESGLPVVVPTGVYGRANFAPQEHRNMSEDELTTLFINEIREGIEGTGIKAGFIKIATGNGPMTALEEKFLRAAGRAASETGAAIASHTPIGSKASRQADILESISPSIRFIWVHAQNESNRSLHRQLAGRGVFIELDSLGWNPGQDSTFIAAIKELLAAGYGEQILLSHDAGWYQPGEQNGGTQKPYTYLVETFIPKLRNSGVDDAAIRMITETNPIRAFGFNYDVKP